MGETDVRFVFRTKQLAALYNDEKGAAAYPTGVVDAFFEVMHIIEAASDERDLYALKSLHFEKLKGARGQRGERSLRLNDQYRLIVRVEKDTEGKYMLIMELGDYHE